MSPILEVWSPNHWTPRGFPLLGVEFREYGDDGDDPNAPVSTVEPEGVSAG